MRKAMGGHEINQMIARYNSECKYQGSHKGTPEEITEMLRESKRRMWSYT